VRTTVTLTTDVLDQGGNDGRALCWQAIFLPRADAAQGPDEPGRVGRDTRKIRQNGSIGVR